MVECKPTGGTKAAALAAIRDSKRAKAAPVRKDRVVQSVRRKKVMAASVKASKPSLNPFRDYSDDALHSVATEVGGILHTLNTEIDHFRRVQSLIQQAMGERGESFTEGLRVADHAIVRWLERYAKLDMQEIKDVIVYWAEQGRPEVAVRNRNIVTILPEGCAAITDLFADALSEPVTIDR